MVCKIEAVYEHGVLRPLEPLPFTESQRVTLTVSDSATGHSKRDLGILERAKAEAAMLKTAPTIEDVRSALASIPGSLAQEIVAERGEY
jgi:predicted DNA-binding antitoxin AbrB/MazE fold protein